MIMDEFTMLNLELVEFMDDLVRVFDKNGFIVYTNSSMKKFVGNEEGKFCFFSDLDVSNNKEKFSTLKCISPISDNREIVTDTVSTLDKVFFVKSSPIYDDKGEYWGSIEVFRDITAESKLGNSLIKYKENTINDMTIAADIQRSLLLKLSHVDGINFEYKYISSDELSGDFFDVIELTENKVCVYMADVMGHGISASMITTCVT